MNSRSRFFFNFLMLWRASNERTWFFDQRLTISWRVETKISSTRSVVMSRSDNHRPLVVMSNPRRGFDNHRQSAPCASYYEPRCFATWFVTCFAPWCHATRRVAWQSKILKKNKNFWFFLIFWCSRIIRDSRGKTGLNIFSKKCRIRETLGDSEGSWNIKKWKKSWIVGHVFFQFFNALTSVWRKDLTLWPLANE
jgi:hypothetical protein